jgi:UDP-N-acetylmuramoyl-L-alanyl-D-glutamate--2,6-diaminopimelate ligase
MMLSQLIQAMEPTGISGLSLEKSDFDIPSIHYQSNDVTPGGMFFAIKGHRLDGHQFVCDAVLKGAAVVIVQERNMDAAGAVAISVDNTKKALAAAVSEI